MKCFLCSNNAQYVSPTTTQPVCLEHAHVWIESVPARRQSAAPLTIRRAVRDDQARLAWLAMYFWDETSVDCFGKQYQVLEIPAFLACAPESPTEIVGFLSYQPQPAAGMLTIAMLSVLPEFQGRGGARQLLDSARQEAQALDLQGLRAATSNDDLPALALYQRYGFVISGIVPEAILRHHGHEIVGFAGIAVRDEIQLVYWL